MRILIVGAGGIGGYLAARLYQAGETPTLLLRGATAEHVTRHGLSLASPLGDWNGPATVITAEKLARNKTPFDLIVITCKSYDLNSVLEAVAPAINAGTVILPLLNGIAHFDAIGARFAGTRVWGGVAHISTTTDGPGKIIHMNELHTFRFGPLDDTVDELETPFREALTRAGIDAPVSESIQQDLWNKFVFLTSLASATCLFRASVGAVVRDPFGRAWIENVLTECSAVAAASGFQQDKAAMDIYRGHLTNAESTMTASMFRDMRAGNTTEGGHVVGDMLARAEQHGLSSPSLAIAAASLRIHEDTIR